MRDEQKVRPFVVLWVLGRLVLSISVFSPKHVIAVSNSA